jgi:hypothetical protein
MERELAIKLMRALVDGGLKLSRTGFRGDGGEISAPAGFTDTEALRPRSLTSAKPCIRAPRRHAIGNGAS